MSSLVLEAGSAPVLHRVHPTRGIGGVLALTFAIGVIAGLSMPRPVSGSGQATSPSTSWTAWSPLHSVGDIIAANEQAWALTTGALLHDIQSDTGGVGPLHSVGDIIAANEQAWAARHSTR